MDMRKRERKGLLPLPPTRTKTSIAFTEITIKVKQGQKQLKKLIYFNEKRLNTINRTRYRKDQGVRIFKKEFENSRLIC